MSFLYPSLSRKSLTLLHLFGMMEGQHYSCQIKAHCTKKGKHPTGLTVQFSLQYWAWKLGLLGYALAKDRLSGIALSR